MATDTYSAPVFSPELEFIFVTVGIVTDSAVTCTYRAVDMGLVLELPLIDMTVKTDFIGATGEYADFSFFLACLMTAHTIDVSRGTV